MLVTQKVAKAKFLGFGFSLCPSMERAIFRPQLFGGVARHPKRFFVRHLPDSPQVAKAGSWQQFEPAIEIRGNNAIQRPHHSSDNQLLQNGLADRALLNQPST